MKNFKLLFGILISTIVLSCSSDDSGGGEQLNTKLPKKITMTYYNPGTGQWNSFSDVCEFFYNSDNTIDEVILNASDGFIYSTKFYYENGFLHQSVYEEDHLTSPFTRTTYSDYFYTNGKLVKVESLKTYSTGYGSDSSSTIEYFYTNGILSTSQSGSYILHYEFSNGNLIKQKDSNSEVIFTYDNKKNPFINLPANLKQVGIRLDNVQEMVFNPNNCNYVNSNNGEPISLNFIYDDDGFPIEREISNSTKATYEYYE